MIQASSVDAKLIKFSELSFVPLVNVRLAKAKMPNSAGVYILLRSDNTPVYIGASSSIVFRVCNNHPKMPEALSLGATKAAWWLNNDEKIVYKVERELITTYRPPLNKQKIKQPKKETIKPERIHPYEDVDKNQIYFDFNCLRGGLLVSSDRMTDEEKSFLLFDKCDVFEKVLFVHDKLKEKPSVHELVNTESASHYRALIAETLSLSKFKEETDRAKRHC